MDNKLFDYFLNDLKDSPEYVKQNVFCYFYYNSKGCSNCPHYQNCENNDEKYQTIKLNNNKVLIY